MSIHSILILIFDLSLLKISIHFSNKLTRLERSSNSINKFFLRNANNYDK